MAMVRPTMFKGSCSTLKGSRAMLTLLAAICILARGVLGDLVMLYSIQRHGARNQLPKDSLLKESDSIGGVTLLPEGQRMCYDAGQAIRARYITAGTCGTNSPSTCLTMNGTAGNYGLLGQAGVSYNNYDVYVRSSSLDRSLLSAQCYFHGVFPSAFNATPTSYLPEGLQMMPVYTQQDTDDLLVRAYTKCNVYQARLKAWYASPEFKAKEADSAALRSRLAALKPGLDVSLTNFWNVFDAFQVWRSFGVGEAMPDIDDATYQQVVDLANWLEIRKMGSDLTGNMLGGVLLSDALSFMAAAANTTLPTYYKMLSVSSHYNTQLGLISALRLDQYAPAASSLRWFKQIPGFASVLLLELHSNRPSTSAPGTIKAPGAARFAVRMVLYDGPGSDFEVVPLPCAQDGDYAEQMAGKGACTLEAFQAYAAPLALPSATAWCAACNNTDAPSCSLASNKQQVASLKQALQTTQAQLQQAQQSGPSPAPAADNGSSSGGGGGNDEWQWRVAVAVVVTFFGTLALIAVGVVAVRAVRGKSGSGCAAAGCGNAGAQGGQWDSFNDPATAGAGAGQQRQHAVDGSSV